MAPIVALSAVHWPVVTRWLRASFLLSAALLASCDTGPPRFTVELNGAAVASRFVVHGNCFAGWYLTLPLRIRGEDVSLVALESMNVSVEEARSGRLLGQEDLPLDAQFPDGDGVQAVDVPVSVRISGDAAQPRLDGPVVVRGEARGRDAGGSLRVPFRLDTLPTVSEVPLPRDGACAAPP
jgi:hypothetical protein